MERDPLSGLRAAVEEAARRDPDRTALDDGTESRSYGELAQRLAVAAERDGGGRQALAVQSSVADVESILARTCAGASLLLLDVKTTERERERAGGLFGEAGQESSASPVLGLCSSGSSGLPKVVELEWESLLANAASFAAAAQYGEEDVLWCTTPLAHLYAFGAGVLGGLLSGATVLLGKGMLEPAEFAQLAAARQPTLLLSVPFLFRRYLKIVEDDPEIARGWALRGAIAAGEPVPAELVSAWRQAAGVPLRSHYGLTEGGQITLAAGEGEEGVGRPIEGVEVRIGEDSEIAVRRTPPARPYRIVGVEPDPDGWYATGDLGHLDEAGNLHVTGRADDRINVAGKKVDPAEVEAALLECEGVEDCTVAAVESGAEVEVVAFLHTGVGAPGDGAIRAELAASLSPHKLPRRFVRVAEIPRTLTGKVRRGHLISELDAAATGAEGRGASAEADGAAVDPDLLETVRAQAAAVVLGHASAEEIDPELTFKELGFDSLAVVALCERLTAATGEEVSPTAAFDHPSPRALAAHLAARASGALATAPAVRSSRFSAEPIAIVGIGCRYPGGVGSAEELWSLVAAGEDAIEPFPGDRGWDLERLYDPDPDSLGTSYVREGGFLAGATGFDAEFFGIGPREALAMDPQQRLLLEVAWEAFEDAGLDPASLAGSRAGVFAGLMSQDYGGVDAAGSSEGYRTTGLAESVVSGRVSFALGLEGPAVTVNTACSSSLVATHLAAQALRLDECDLALAGGVTVMATPTEFIEFSRQRGLAPDGRCKAFAAAADGTGFSEGVGLLVLERLADAEANGRRIYATIRGSAINQDGASNGLTAPNGPSQERVIRQALANAGLSPADVDAVEAHGTGTALGDPIEAGALIATYGQDRERPLRLGSVKSNIGHTQAAAGVAGVIKMAMAMREGLLPQTLHVDRPSPHVEWSAGEVELLSEPQDWEEGEAPRRAAVSSFGISGTNAHLILEEGPGTAGEAEGPGGRREAGTGEAVGAPLPGLLALPLSAKSEDALREMAADLAARFGDPELDPADVAFSLATIRARLERRAVVVGADRRQLVEGLERLAAGEPPATTVEGSAHDGKLAFLFTGQGAQRAGMGRELYEASPPFARALDEACEAFAPHLDRDLKELLFAPEGSSEAELLDHTAHTQPALFALEVALFRAVEALGARPDYLAGHSIGELSAAHLAGVFSLEDAAKLVSARGALMGALPAGGAMVAIEASEEEVAKAIEGKETELAIAAVNGPGSVVVSGAETAALAVQSHFEELGARTKRLAVSHAFHSPLIEPMLEEFAEVARSVEYRPPRIPIVSDLSGELLDAEQAQDPAYWVAHAREAVRFADAVATLQREGVGAYLELGPDGVLTAMAASCLGDGRAVPALIATLRPDRPEPEALLLGLAAVQVAGARVEWEALYLGARWVPLPTYPFQRRRYWLDSGSGSGDAASLGQRPLDHPLLAAVVEDPAGERLTLTGVLSAAAQPWIGEHDLLDARLLPSSALLELALVAAAEAGCDTVEELTLQTPVLLPESGGLSLQLEVGKGDERGSRPLSIHARGTAEDAEWTLHGTGTLRDGGSGAASSEWQLDEADAEVEIEEEQRQQASRFLLHPALLEAALDAAADAAGRDDESAPTWVAEWKGVRLLADGASSLRARLSPTDDGRLRLLTTDRGGTPVLAVDSLQRAPLKLEQLEGDLSRSMYRVGWEELALPESNGESEAVLLDVREWAEGEPVSASHVLAERALERIHVHLEGPDTGDSCLVFLTAGALQTDVEEEPNLAASALAGLLRSACSEHPGRFALLDTDGAQASEAALADALVATAREPQIALREGTALVPRLARAEEIESAAEAPLFDPGRTVLITGGTGGLGALLAEHLVAVHGVRHLLLLSRSGAGAEGAEELRDRLQAQGAEVAIAVCDVSDRADLARALADVPAEHPLGGVVHAAAVVDNGLLADLDAERLNRVMAPKLDAAWHLHELTAELDLSAFVLFSSAAGLLGGPGQGNYAAANSFLDALAFLRRGQGLPATSLAWGLWDRESNLGGRGTEAEREQLVRQTRTLLGFAPLASERGLRLFDAAAGFAGPLLAPVSFDRAALRAQAESGSLPAPMRGMVRAPERRRRGGDSLAERLAAQPQSEHEAFAIEFVRGHVAAVLGHGAASAVDPEKAFKDLGFDSLATVELRNRLVAATGVQLAATRAFDYPSTAALARFLLAEVGAGAGPGRVVARARATEEPIAIVGIGCRYPGGVGSAEELWSLVAAGEDAIEPFPGDRGWDLERLYDPDPDNRGTSYVREAGFLAAATGFDAEFFGIGPREALAMDPQQRLLLEIAWETFEDAGLDPAALRGSETGVFAGIATSDYAALPRSRPELEGHIGTGNVGSVVSGRVAYSFDLAGPAITVDTACSSSLVAAHLACESLRGGGCSLALAGGVTVLATPETYIEFSRQRGLAPDGRCKAFAAAADGTGFSEGVGLLVLERLADAEANGRRIYATIRGSAINQDGASNGLTAPNGPSQERVIRQALANAGLSPADVDAVEAHGTGTALGDPIEAGALIATYGQDRERPLRLGSVKSNIGHTQAAAGVAGVIKMAMAMREGLLPQTLHVDDPSPHVDWSAGKVELLSEPQDWEQGEAPRRAGVSSFGISGTNAHLILEEGPGTPQVDRSGGEGEAGAARVPVVWPLSAKGEEALRDRAGRLLASLRNRPELDPLDVGFSLAARAQLSHRAVLLGEGREQLLAGLERLAAGRLDAVEPIAGATAFLFTGQGAQRPGMGRDLHAAFPVFAESLEAACAELGPHLERPLLDLLFADEDSAEAALLDRTEFTQPALFAIEVGLFRLLESWGLRPDYLAGHSIGELSAAHAAGILTLSDAARLVAARGRLMGGLEEGGAMVAIGAGEAEVAEYLAGEEGLSLAAVNDPGSVVVSGEEEAALRAAAAFEGRGRKVSRLRVSHAFHSHRMEPILAELAAVAAELEFSDPRIPVVSDVTGELLDAEQAASPEYWARQAREPVRFLDAVRTLAERGVARFLELGPDAVLSAMVDGCLEGDERPIRALALMREERPEVEALLGALSEAHASGLDVSWPSLFDGSGAARVELPPYPFQRRRFWLEPSAGAGDLAAAGLAEAPHPLLGAAVSLAGEEGRRVFTGSLSLDSAPWLAEHSVAGAVLLPGAACAELALAAGRELDAEMLEEMIAEAPLVVPPSRAVQVQLAVGEAGEQGERSFSLHSRPSGEGAEWVRNASGTLAPAPAAAAVPEPMSWPPQDAEPVDVSALYDELHDEGFQYGPSFQGLRAAWRRGEEVFAEVDLNPGLREESARYAVHPALLDCALQAGLLADRDGGPRLPFTWSGVWLGNGPFESLRVRVAPRGDGSIAVSAGDTGGVVALRIDRLAMRPLEATSLGAGRVRPNSLFALRWHEVEAPEASGEAEVELLRPARVAGSDAAAAREQAEALLAELQLRLGAEEGVEKIALLTRGAVATRDGESPDPAAAALWGLVRSAQAEHPGRLLLVDGDGSGATEEALDGAIALALGEDEPQLAIREGRVLVGRLEGVAAAEPPPPAVPEATTLITGATGALGSRLARHLVAAHGARHLLLVSRRGPEAEGAPALLAELAEMGAEARLVACDVADRESLAAAIGSIPAANPLGTVIHAAGTIDDGLLADLTAERLRTVFRAKVEGAWNLHELTEGLPLERFVLASAFAGTMGSPAQANYAAANAFCDALASRRASEGRVATAIAFGLWESEGAAIARRSDAYRARMRRTAFLPLGDEEGLALFDAAIAAGEPQLLAAPLDTSTLRAQARTGQLAAPMRGLVSVPRAQGPGGGSLPHRIAAAPAEGREAIVLAAVREETASVLGHDSAAAVAPERPFKDLGFDSLAAVELRNRLGLASGSRLPSTIVFDHPTPAALAGFLLERLAGGDASPSIDTELDALESRLADVDESERMSALVRLRAILRRLSLQSDGDGDDDDIHRDLDTASDEEVIQLIEEEFGSV